MYKRIVQQVCLTLAFLLGSIFGFSISLFHGKEQLQNHIIILILLAATGFHITQLSKGFGWKKKS